MSASNAEYQFGDGDRLSLHITAPDLNAFAVQGAGDVEIQGVAGDALAVVLSGAGEVTPPVPCSR